jgi:ABC-type maltose transport system permease subunit
MDNTKPHQDFFEKVSYFVTSPVTDLIQNIKSKQQGVLIFNELEQGFKEFQDILSHVKIDSILTLPEFKIIELKQRLNPLFLFVDTIQNSQKNPQQTDHQQKQQIVQQFTKPINYSNPNDSGFFIKEKDPVWQIIVQSIALSNNNVKKDEEAKAILKRLQEIEKNANSTTERLTSILNSAQSELSKSGVEVHSEIFREQADTHEINSKNWRKYSIIMLVFTIVLALTFFFIIAFAVSETKKIIETSVLAALIISMSTYALTLIVKNYFAEKHNESINRHKANCLSTFNTFVDSADDERKSAVLLQATQTIFSHQSSGFLSKENDVHNPNPIVEIVRGVTSK